MIAILKHVYITGNMPNRLTSTTSQKGFTLVEMLVATAIFIVAIVLALDIFMIVVRDQFTEIQRKQVEDEILFIFGEMNGNLDHTNIQYTSYTSLPATDVLYLDDGKGGTMIIALGGVYLGGDTDKMYIQGGSGTYPLSGEHTSIDSLQFYVYPSSDPFDVTTGTYTNNQPTVVMYIKAHHIEHPEISVEYQTMITSRFYVR